MKMTDQIMHHGKRKWAMVLLVALASLGTVAGPSRAWAEGGEGSNFPQVVNYKSTLQPSVGNVPLPPGLAGKTTIFAFAPTAVGNVVTIQWNCPGFTQMATGTMQKHFLGIPGAAGISFPYPLAWGPAGPPIGCKLRETVPASMPGPLGAFRFYDVPNNGSTAVFVDHGYF